MGSGVTAQESEGQPTTVDILRRGRHETTHIVTPEREATQSETQTTTQVTQHTDIVRSRIATPVEGIALGTSPGRTCPDDALAGILLLDSLPEGLIIAQGIEVVLIETTLATVVEAIVGCCLTEITLDGRDTLFQQTRDLLLIPADGLGVREVEHGILIRHTTRGVRHVQTLLDDLGEETVFRGEIRQLPQTGVETVLP